MGAIMKNKQILIISVLGILISACQSTSNLSVVQRADSTFEALGIGKTRISAREDALGNAKKTCYGKTPIILKEDAKYNGVLDERTERFIDNTSSALSILFGKDKTPSLARDDDYEYTVSFRCP